MSNRLHVLVAASLLGACASGGTPTSGAAISARAAPEQDESGLYRPDQIIQILEGSGIEYTIVSDAVVSSQELTDILVRPARRTGPMDPFFEIERRPDGRPHLKSHGPSPEVETLFDAAQLAFEANDYDAARRLYARAIEVEPDYFKAYTYLGNSLYLLGDYRRAELAFEKALSLNPVDYQALLFLGDTYYQLGEYARSKTVLTRAFMLNRRNPIVLERLQASLAKMRLRVREKRLSPPEPD